MKFKKLISAVISTALAFTMTGILPNAEKNASDNPLANLSDAFNITPFSVSAESSLRRPCSAESPMWIVHIETWNTADPQKIIELIPDDLKPYVVFNISMSIYWDGTNHRWGMVNDGYQLAKSWLRTCADEGVWAMIQPSSGGQSHFPDYDASGNIVDFPNKDEFAAYASDDYEDTIYAEFFRDYPNFIGYNYCEQFWGFDQADFPISTVQRYEHFAKLLKLCNKYGGYLDISWCANQWSPNINPIAMLKRVPAWEEACRNYSENFILEEKYTQASYIADVESQVYGAYVSGYCGNFGIRYDETGWTDSTWSGTGESTKNEFRASTALPIYMERMVKNGATVIDGPELVTVDDFKELMATTDSEGYTVRNWGTYDQFQNDTLDFFRKIIDGTVRIPDREEVIENTKVVIIQDVNTGNNDDKYSTYPTLFEGLYRMSGDGNLKDNHNLYKSTGRYQTIPTVYALKDDLAKSIPVQVNQSEISSRWSTIDAKITEFNNLYASDYYGNCYAGRNENTWIAYNSNKNGALCGSVLSLKYNTCKDVDIAFSAYGSCIMNEYSDKIDFYLNNYDEEAPTTLRTDTIKISGCKSEPQIILQKDRGRNQTKSEVSASYSNGTYTITVKHNGPIDISVNCSGNETGRSTLYPTAKVVEPAAPDFYEGTRQYEGELFNYKNIEGNVPNGCGSGIDGFWGQGFIKFGTKENAAVKDTVTSNKAGTFDLNLRYSATSDVKNVDLYVNGSKVKTLSLAKGSSLSDWKTITEKITLNEGNNKIELKANSILSSTLYIDCFTVDGDFGSSGSKIMNGTLIKNLFVNDTENISDWSIDDSNKFDVGSTLFGDRDITAVSVPVNLIGAEVIKTACDSKLVTTDLGSFTAGDDITIYIAMDSRVTNPAPEWLDSWTKTDLIMKTSNDLTLLLYKKNVNLGTAVTLGTNGGSNDSVNYVVLAVKQELEPLNGTLIKNLIINDKENGADWSIQNDFENGAVLYGDRDITAASIPSNLNGLEYIRTACDSKLLTANLGSFIAGADMTVYIAMDSRVTNTAPEWINSYTKTSDVITTSNDVTLEIYKKDVKSGEGIVLGTNSGSGNAANYIVFASGKMTVIKGDLNFDGRIDVFDLCLAKKYYVNGFDNELAEEAADVDYSGTVEISDLKQIQDFLIGKITNFTEAELNALSPEIFMNQVRANVVESEPSSATVENAETEYGTFEKVTINSLVCAREKNFNVLLPADYATTKKYPVLYVLHGYWGDEDALLDNGDASLRLRQIIGNAIASGEAEDMIVVFPDIYASNTQDKCDGLNEKNNKAYDNFINLLTKEIMPYMEQNYSIKTGRDNTAITGFSMGGRESLYIGFSRPDLFGYVGAMCPAPGLTTDLINAEDLKFTDSSTNPYMLFISAGSNDTLIYSTPTEYHDTLTQNGVDHIWHYVTGGDHGGKTIRPHIYNFIRSVFKATE